MPRRPGTNTLRNRVIGQARSRALNILARRHLPEYDAIFDEVRKELLTEHGLPLEVALGRPAKARKAADC